VINADTFTVSTEDNVSCTRKTFSSESELLEILINWKNEMYSDEGEKRLRRFQQIAPMLYWERCYPSFVGRWHGRPVVHITEKYLRAFLEENEGDQIDHHFTGEGGHERLFNVLEGWIGRNFMTQEQEQAQKQEQNPPQSEKHRSFEPTGYRLESTKIDGLFVSVSKSTRSTWIWRLFNKEVLLQSSTEYGSADDAFPDAREGLTKYEKDEELKEMISRVPCSSGWFHPHSATWRTVSTFVIVNEELMVVTHERGLPNSLGSLVPYDVFLKTHSETTK